MKFRNHVQRQYLRCKNNKRNNGCSETRKVRYDSIFEPLLHQYCRGLDVSDVLPKNEQKQTELSKLRNELRAVEGVLEEIETAIKNRDMAIAAAEEGRAVEFHIRKIQRLLERQDKKEQEKTQLKNQIDQRSNVSMATAKRLEISDS